MRELRESQSLLPGFLAAITAWNRFTANQAVPAEGAAAVVPQCASRTAPAPLAAAGTQTESGSFSRAGSGARTCSLWVTRDVSCDRDWTASFR
jgi:hypothetical protein